MTLADDTSGCAHRFVLTNGVRLHVLVGGAGPLVVLLHGFPECWATWRHVVGPLIAAGYTIAAPDLRGYNLSDKPPRVADYRVEHVADDIVGLVHALGFQTAHVVGHDWGGAVAWHMGQRHDAVLDKLVIVNSPHPGLFTKRLRSSLQQLRRSYYMFLFQVPVIAERTLSRDRFAVLRTIMKHQPKRPGAFDDEDAAVYQEAMAQPGAVTGALNYYRAGLRAGLRDALAGRAPARDGVVLRPLLVVWGMDDVALLPENLDGLDRVAGDLRIVRLTDCSHWVQHDAPERLVEETLRFLA